MVGVLAAAACIAKIPGLTVTTLCLISGAPRATAMLPTVLTLAGKELAARGVFFGILVSLVIGMPVFITGTVLDSAALKTAGSLCTLLLSGAVCIATAPGKAVRA